MGFVAWFRRKLAGKSADGNPKQKFDYASGGPIPPGQMGLVGEKFSCACGMMPTHTRHG